MNTVQRNGTFKTILISVSASFVTLGLITNMLLARDEENKSRIDTTCIKTQQLEIEQASQKAIFNTKLDTILEALREVKEELKDIKKQKA